MTISNVALTNTFDEWRVTTNQLVVAVNGITEGNSNVNFMTANAIVVAGVNVGTTLAAAFNQANTANAASGVAASTYGGATQIPVFTVDTRGKVTSASNVAVQGMDYAYANAIGAASNGWTNTVAAGANAWTNTQVATVYTQANTARDHANAAFAQANTANTAAFSANAASGVVASTYGGATQIPVFTVDTRGKVTSASNVAVSVGSLTIADGKTLTVSNTLTLAGTDGTTMTFPPASASVGYINIPQNSQSDAYTTVAADSGKHILHPTADNNPRTFTIAANASVAYAVGTAITFINQINTVTIAINSDTLVLAGAGSTGSRTLAANGIATAVKIASTTWFISGTGLT